jgi:hypothetical protein
LLSVLLATSVTWVSGVNTPHVAHSFCCLSSTGGGGGATSSSGGGATSSSGGGATSSSAGGDGDLAIEAWVVKAMLVAASKQRTLGAQSQLAA